MFDTIAMVEWLESEIAAQNRLSREEPSFSDDIGMSSPSSRRGDVEIRRASLLDVYDRLTILLS
ncbi:hypothetical protein [Rhizobium sp. WYJ-E13]|uniref:hypothetical protein n=1 Tax=Rhizobium sp. WYJ-E13 TaxID=2849093 RepID=UPI001C1EDAA7|nr:hypothetical protein [Rhizobium sp. WYJ-E13]QWW72289.1 hypothetical protein KQ933_32445 [Rhizobium sp. WYJ-E13]